MYSDPEEVTLESLNSRLSDFHKMRSAGYGLELAGVAVTGIAIAADTPEIAIGGVILSLAGLIVNATAGKSLKGN